MRVVLAEKPSVARELASFLGAGSRRDGYFEGRGYQVTWALGHLATLKEPEDYDPALKTWSLATLPIVPERFELKPIELDFRTYEGAVDGAKRADHHARNDYPEGYSATPGSSAARRPARWISLSP